MAPGVSKNINIGLPEKPKVYNNSLFTAALLIIICGLFGFFIILPKQSALAVKKTQLNQLTTQEASLTAQMDTLTNLITQLKNNSDSVKELDEAMPLNGETFDLQILLQSMADSSGVTVGSINLSGDTGVLAGDTALLKDPFAASRSLKQITGQAYVIGSFPQVLNFLEKVENSDRIIQISSLGIATDQGSNLSLKIQFQAYYFAP